MGVAGVVIDCATRPSGTPERFLPVHALRVAVPEEGASSCVGLATERVRSHVLTLPPWRPSTKRPVTLPLPGTGLKFTEHWGRGVLHVLEGSVRCSGDTADAAEVVLAQ